MIHRFRVRNFKSIVDVDVELSPVTVLVGRSGTGKSNFVHALRFLRDVLSAKQHPQQEWPEMRPMTAAPDAATAFEVEFAVEGVDGGFQYKLSIHKNGPGQPPYEERLALGDRCFFHQVNNDRSPASWIVEPELIPVPNPGAIALGRIPSISEVVIAFTALTSGIGCYVFSDNVLRQPGGDGRSRDVQQGRGLADDARNYLDELMHMNTNLRNLDPRKLIVATMNRLNPSISAVELDNIQRPSKVMVSHKFNGKTYPLDLSRESDGFRRFYAHLLAIYQDHSKQTLIFEHPEDGIHPGALSLLAEEFQAAPAAGRGQVILTTHSPSFLDHFDADQIRVVELADLETRIGSISDEQKLALRERLLEPGELLTVDPARMQLAGGV